MRQPLSTGELSHRVTVQTPAPSIDALGQRADGWADLATVWAKVEPLRGREYFAAGAMQSVAEVRISLRYRADITGAMRVLWRGIPHAIVSPPIDVDGARHTLELMCAAGVRDTAGAA